MDAGSLAQMAHSPFGSAHGLAMPSGLASRRGGQNIKPLSFDSMKTAEIDNGVPTPRTSRGHLLAGLRTAPKTATAAQFSNLPGSPTTFSPQARNRNSMGPTGYDGNMFNGPKTSLPRYGGQQQHLQQSQQQMGFGANVAFGQQYTADQVLAPPQLQMEDHLQEQLDPNLQAQILYQKAYLSEQQQRLQQQLMLLQAAAQQFQGLNLSGQAQMMQQGYSNMYQQQLQNAQAMMTPVTPQQNVYAMYDPVTGQQTLYVDQGQGQLQPQVSPQAVQQNPTGVMYAGLQHPNAGAPRVQVSPPPEQHKSGFRNTSPPRRYDSPIENPIPLPPPSANAFRRGHKKSSSIANGNKGGLSIATDEAPRGSGPKTASFPLTPMTAGYGPGQARAGEHPVRQPRNPPSMDELKSKPTAKHDGSKNFVTRTRRSAVSNLVRAGLERRKDTRSTGSSSPISETSGELVETPLADNDSDSGRSGSGSLIDHEDAECSLPSSRTSTGSWGAIGSDRPSSRQKLDRSSGDNTSDNEAAPGSFASLLKSAHRGEKAEVADAQRKAPMLVLTSAEKRKLAA